MLLPMALSSVSWMLLSCLMLLSQVQGEDPKMELPSVRISCPKGSKAYGLYCYALFLNPKSWMDADMACQKRSSGHLVSVLSGAEGSFVASLIKSSLNSYSYIWIGLHDPTQEYHLRPYNLAFIGKEVCTKCAEAIITDERIIWASSRRDIDLGLEPNAGGWEWSSTDVMNHLAWERNPSTVSNPGHCGTVSQSTGFLKWRDFNCDASLPYICKFKD